MCSISSRIWCPTCLAAALTWAPSNNSVLKGEEWFSPECREGRNIHFGIREFAMAAMCNGMALHGGVRPFCATFFVFSDYMRNAIRLSALMQTNVLYVLTHDSISVGEDGPTHEPIEQLASFRAMPGCTTFRPCRCTRNCCQLYLCAGQSRAYAVCTQPYQPAAAGRHWPRGSQRGLCASRLPRNAGCYPHGQRV